MSRPFSGFIFFIANRIDGGTMNSFDPDKWLQLGIAGGTLFILLLVIILFIRTLGSSHKQWSATVDRIAERQDTTQKETNTVLRDLSGIMHEVKAEVRANGHVGKAGGGRG